MRRGRGCPVPDTAGSSRLQPAHPGAPLRPLSPNGGPRCDNEFKTGKKTPDRERRRKEKGVRNSRGDTKVRGGAEEVLQALDQGFPAARGRDHAEQRESVRREEQQREALTD